MRLGFRFVSISPKSPTAEVLQDGEVSRWGSFLQLLRTHEETYTLGSAPKALGQRHLQLYNLKQ